MNQHGTQYKLVTECGLDRRNIQFEGVLDLFSEPKITWSNFLVDLKVQSSYCIKIRPGSGFYKIFKINEWLNMNSKPDKECEKML